MSNVYIGKLKNSRGDHYGFNFYYDTDSEAKGLAAGDSVIIPLPGVTPNKRSINDVGWMTNSDNVRVYATLSSNPDENDGENALWQEVSATQDINKVCSALKFENTSTDADSTPARVVVRVIMC